MEIHIDTSLINNSSHKNSNSIRNEELILKELEGFVTNNSEICFSNVENLTVLVEYFLIEDPEDKNLVLFGKVLKNNQTLYDLEIDDRIIVYVKNSKLINDFLINFIKVNSKNEKDQLSLIYSFNIINCFVLKVEGVNKSIIEDNIKLKALTCLILFTSALKVFFSLFLKYRYNHWDEVLILSKTFQISFLNYLILSCLDYKICVSLEHFSNCSKEDFTMNSEGLNLYDLKTINEESRTFKFIFDHTEGLSKNKLKYFSLLSFEGNYLKFNNYKFADTKPLQLDPRDLDYLQNKNCSINFTCLESCIENNLYIGRLSNYLLQIFDKIVFSNDNVIGLSKQLIKKLRPKIEEGNSLKEIEFSDISKGANNNYMSIFVLHNQKE
jgi:hypothetical protein